jgi:midasin (ATPase involved in ribosome maturation)
LRYRGGELGDDALMRRETEEIYRGGLFDPLDLKAVDDILTTTMPYSGGGFYETLDLKETRNVFSIGDVMLRKLNTGHRDVPGTEAQLVLTKRTKEVLYRTAKALDMGENPLLIGERASGKTADVKMLAHLLGMPYERQIISGDTDTMELVGGYDDGGWKDGPLLRIGRPEKTPGMLLVDEINFGSSALLERFNPVLDDERKIVLSEKEGEEIRLHPDARILAAMNPPTKRYAGRKKLSKALMNRMTPIYVPDLDGRDEQLEIISALGSKAKVPEPVSEALINLHHWAVDGYAEGGTLGAKLRPTERPVLSIRQPLRALETLVSESAEHDLGTAFLRAIEVEYASTSDPDDNKAIMSQAETLAK